MILDSSLYLVLSGVVIGFIIMTIFYNLAIFFYIKERTFLYYAIMQIFMTPIVTFHTKIIPWDTFYYALFSIFASIFAILFARSFLETEQYLPKIDIVLKVYLLLLTLDLIPILFQNYSYVVNYDLFGVCGLLYLLMGFLRARQGFFPAWFFLIGWTAFIGSLLYVEIVKNAKDLDSISIFLLGPPTEAILLSVALAYSWKLMQKEKQEQQELLIHQSKLASMGEMIGNIAHQWKQPLTYLSYNFMNLREAEKRNILDGVYLNKKLDKAEAQLEFMSQTIDNFKDFYLPNKTKEKFLVEKASLEIVEIISHQFHQNNIEIIINTKEDIELISYRNAYKQVLLNLLSNAKDVFVQRDIEHPKVIVTIDKNYVLVEDNAGGIPIEIINRIYEP
ncbi:MAG: sensor histidine kinase, partial [Sulfurovaceae bacterium]|nr:sensor histidine kinase [Sulfurovaceae bacterium]